MEKTEKNKGVAFNPGKFIKLCVKSWKAFVIAVILCVGLMGFYSVWHLKLATVEAQLMLKDDPGSGGSMMLGDLARSFSLGDMFGSSTTDNEASIMRSHSVFLKTVKQLGLNTTYQYPKFGVKWVSMPLTSPIRLVAPENISDTISVGLVFDVDRQSDGKYDIVCKKKRTKIAGVDDVSMPYSMKTPYGVFTFELTPNAAKPATRDIDRVRVRYCSYSAAAETYAKLVKIYVPDRKTDFIGMSFETIDPEFGVMVLDSLIANYTNVGNDYKIERSKQSLKLVNERLASLTAEIGESEAAMENFKKANKLTDVEIDASYLMTRTGEIEGNLFQAQSNYEIAKLTRDFINKPENKYSLIPDLYGASGIAAADATTEISAYNQLVLTRMEMLTSSKPGSPAIKQIDEQLDAMHKNISATINRVYENAKLRLDDLKKENSRTKDRLGEIPTLERQYINIKRDDMLLNQMYLFLLQQREELNMSLASRSLPAQVIDAPHALVDNGSFSTMVLLALGVVLGLLAGAVYVFLFKMPKAKIDSESEFAAHNSLPVSGHVKKADKRDAFVALADGVNAEAFRHLRAEVQQALKSCDGKVVMVTSVHAGEGKTYVSVNLAGALAKLGKKVVLVDASLRNPGVASALGVTNPTAALTQYVQSRGNANVDIVSVAIDSVDSMDVITAAASDANASDILGSDAMKRLVESLAADYDYVVIDSTCIEGYSDASYLTEISDVTLIVCRKGCVTIPDTANLNLWLSEGRYKRMTAATNGF